MTKFYSNTNRPPRMRENFTKREQDVYVEDIDKKTGERYLRKDSTVDIYDKIQEYADEVNISTMIKRHNLTLSLTNNLKLDESKIVDMTQLPENLIETMAVIDNAKAIFDRQSTEIKQKFNNDFKQFIAGSENGQVVDMLNEKLQTNHVQADMPSYQELLSAYQARQKQVVQPTVQETQKLEGDTNV